MRRPAPPSRSVPCPYCGAPAGRLCTTSTGNSSHESHSMRRARIQMMEAMARAMTVDYLIPELTRLGVTNPEQYQLVWEEESDAVSSDQ